VSIRHRITLLIVLSIIAIFTIGGYSIYQARLNATEVKKVSEGVVPSALATADLVSQVKEVQLVTMALVSEPDANLASQASKKLTTGKARLKEGIDFQFEHAADKVQQGLVEQAKENLSEYFGAVDDTVKFKLAGQSDLAAATYYSNVVVLQRELQQIVETLRIEKGREKDGAIAALNENLSKTATGVTSLSLIIVVVLSGFGIVLYRQIISPISQMQAMTSEIASSQDFTRQVPVQRMDEIGRSIVAFNKMITKIQENSILLKQKTSDIQTMLQNMPQGILTVTTGNVVHSEYSAYLESIFETREIAGCNMMALVFSGTNLGADTLSQVEAVVAACVGEDVMNFEFNKHLLVGEIEKSMPDGRVKILDLSWSPIADDSNNTVRVMLCVRDVTELRKLAAEANTQKHELEIIGEILSISQDKFHEFINGSFHFVEENELLIRENTEINADVLTKLFRNMHTIKGNARTYGLHHLTNTVHLAEQSYVELRKPRPDIAWDQKTLIEELLTVKDALEHYARTNEVSLGRKGPGRRSGVEHFLMVDKLQIQETILRLERANTGNLHELLAVHEVVRKTLRLLGTERIIEMLEGVFDSLPSLAAELGKLPPIIDIQDNGYVVRSQVGGVLKNVFMHLLRNSMDHGLETPEIRQLSNKPLAGTISLSMAVKDGMLQIRLADDGRGLALAHIRALAIEKQLIDPAESPGDEEIANLIFRPGFTTASAVTEVSGRGVGMDAVQNFIQREKGAITINFNDDKIGADFRQFEFIVSLPEALTENVEGFEFHQKDEFEESLLGFGFEKTPALLTVGRVG
jgi:two-component system chemotaxis sensor kinase CheA